jgi:hypothetical protein
MAFSHQFSEQQAILETQRFELAPVVKTTLVRKHQRLHKAHSDNLALGSLDQKAVGCTAQHKRYRVVGARQTYFASGRAIILSPRCRRWL